MEYEIIYSKRKTIAIQIRPDTSIVVRAPYRCSKRAIDAFVKEKELWIQKTIVQISERAQKDADIKKLSSDELSDLYDKARQIIPGKVEYYAQILGVDYGRISIRNQTTRWGSCSSKGNLNFNCKLMLVPEEILDYVVVHELCHRIHMNHSKAFWAEVAAILPDYASRKNWLKQNGHNIMLMS